MNADGYIHRNLAVVLLDCPHCDHGQSYHLAWTMSPSAFVVAPYFAVYSRSCPILAHPKEDCPIKTFSIVARYAGYAFGGIGILKDLGELGPLASFTRDHPIKVAHETLTDDEINRRVRELLNAHLPKPTGAGA